MVRFTVLYENNEAQVFEVQDTFDADLVVHVLRRFETKKIVSVSRPVSVNKSE